MRSILIFTLLVSSLSFTGLTTSSQAASESSQKAQVAPNFMINTPQLSGSLQDLKGKVVYVDFWASWCKPCRQSFPWMNDMQQKYAAAGLQVIAINLDTEPELAKNFLAKVPAHMPIVYDPQGNIAKDYALIGMPSSYLIDSQGAIRFAHKGFFSNKQTQYEQQIITLLAETE